SSRAVPPNGQLRRQDSQGREACRSARRAAHEVRSGHQPQDRQGAWPDNPTVAPRTSGPGDRVVERRTFIGTLTGGLLAAPLASEAQQGGKVWRIGYLLPAEGHNPIDEAFERSMKALGYVEGKNFTLERRYAAGRPDRLGAAAAE